jgi:hypothetical protein
MAQTLDLEGLAKKNPRVDLVSVKKVLDTVAEVRKHGVSRANYSISSPYSRKRGEPQPEVERSRLRFNR